MHNESPDNDWVSKPSPSVTTAKVITGSIIVLIMSSLLYILETKQETQTIHRGKSDSTDVNEIPHMKRGYYDMFQHKSA